MIKVTRLAVSLVFGSGLLLAQTAEPPKYTGPGSCASPSCHGGVQVRTDTSVQQNEYSTWVVKDKHAHAFAVLTNPVATRMAKILGPDKLGSVKAEAAPKCLACHALSPADPERARTFDSTDGVSCESCHGPASNWLGPHTTKGWTHERSIAAGMRDLRDPVRRAENCLTCHLGTADKAVDHEMIAAGHPDLYFELASFTAAMPRHWREHAADDRTKEDPFADVRMLVAGQAVQLREQLQRVARNAQGNSWPEFADLDCFACHHSLTNAENSWRQELGYAGRKAGNPPWNLSRYAVLRQIVNEMDREGGRRLETEIDKLYAIMSAGNQDRNQAAAQARATSDVAGRLAQQISAGSFDQARTQRLLQAIARDGDHISRQGERAAEQATMALQSLYIAYASQARANNDTQIRAALKALFQQVENPSAYNAPKFAEQMRALSQVLP
ncbi:MAG: cytochrome c family protein [Acidobacteriia bacterium]|nr:cytochrome c family protein [Terriglobia bacterium]